METAAKIAETSAYAAYEKGDYAAAIPLFIKLASNSSSSSLLG